MINFFTENELDQLKILKNELLIYPINYFFKRLNDFSELRVICKSMFSLQWQYLNSGLSLLIDSIKILGQALYSLITLQFSIAGKQFCSATKAALAAITKLSLDLGLLFLHITRLLTLFLVAFYPQIISMGVVAATIALLLSGELLLGVSLILFGLGAICYNLAGILKQNNELSNSIHEQQEYDQMADEIYTERSFIVNRIKVIDEKLDRDLHELKRIQQERSANPYKLFTPNHLSQIPLSPEVVDHAELTRHLYNAINNYPEFIVNGAKEASYVVCMYRELEEHHERTKLLANEFFRQMDLNELQREELYTHAPRGL